LYRDIRVIVLSRIPSAERNALWELFSAVREKVQDGASHYHWRKTDCSSVVNQLYLMYGTEGLDMPYTIEQFKKDVVLDYLDELPPEDRLKGLTVEERLKGLPAEERLKGLPAEERLKGLPAKERLKGLPAEVIEAHLRKISGKRKRK